MIVVRRADTSCPINERAISYGVYYARVSADRFRCDQTAGTLPVGIQIVIDLYGATRPTTIMTGYRVAVGYRGCRLCTRPEKSGEKYNDNRRNGFPSFSRNGGARSFVAPPRPVVRNRPGILCRSPFSNRQ